MDQYLRDYNVETVETYVVNNEIEYNNLVDSLGSNIKILQQNIRSMVKNFDEFLVSLELLKYSFDVIILTETFQIYDLELYKINGFDLLYNRGNINKNDGVLIYIKNNIKYSHKIIDIGEISSMKLNIFLENGGKIILTAIYRSPSTSPYKFNTHLLEYLRNLEKCTVNMLVGDININILSDADYAQEYLNILSMFEFVSYINKPTREKSCLDHFFIKTDKYKIVPIIYKMNITDHNPTIVALSEIKLKMKNTISECSKEYINFHKLKCDLGKEAWCNIYNINDIDTITDIFLMELQRAISRNTREIKIKKSEVQKKPWITAGLLKSVNKKNKLYQNLLKSPNNKQLEEEYKKYKNKLTNLIIKAKRAYIRNEINKNNTTTTNLWKTVNNICNKQKSTTNISNIESEVGIMLDNKKDIANSFAKYYTELGEKYASKINSPANYKEVLPILPNSMCLFPTDENEIKRIIVQLKPKKSPGIDNIRAETLKMIKNEISKPLTYIINKCFEIGYFPQSLKIGLIQPIYKGGDLTQHVNYRPISLITNIAKILEKCIKHRLIKFLKKFHIISSNQFGFQEKKSTQDALASLTKYIYSAIDDTTPCLCIFVDLAKAFDTVCHKHLLHKLFNYGLRGNAYKLFESYLKDRKQLVKIDGVISNPQIVKFGVPQGTVLGPVLFSLYINSLLSQTVNKGEIISFADDTAILYREKSWDEVKRTAKKEFREIKNWFDYNKLTVNFQKTTYMVFTSYSNHLPDLGPIEIDRNLNILESESVKYLGMIIDRHFRWDLQIKNVIKKVRGLLAKFKYLKNYLDTNQLRMLYHALVQPHLTYGLIGWGGACDSYIKQLEILQKWILKIIYSKNITYPSDALYTENKIFDIRQLYSLTLLTYNFKHKDEYEKIKHNYETRYKEGKFKTPKSKKTIGQRSFVYLIPRLYNRLPTSLTNIRNIELFRKKIKLWLHSLPRKEIKDIIYTNIF